METATAARASVYICTDCGLWSTQLRLWPSGRQTCGSCDEERRVSTGENRQEMVVLREQNVALQRRIDHAIDRGASSATLAKIIATRPETPWW